MSYVKFSENYNINKLIPSDHSPYKYIKNRDKPHFVSMVKYNENHYNEWKKTRSVEGFVGGKASRIWLDFDSENNLDQAFKDTRIAYHRLKDLDIPDEAIQIAFSGNKGGSLIVELNEDLNLDQVKNFTFNLAKDLTTFDKGMYDHQRIFRLLFTKNEKTGLFKIPLTPEELENFNVDEIKESAKDLSGFDMDSILEYYTKFTINNKFKALMNTPTIKEVTNKVETVTSNINWSDKPKHWRNCKWSLLQGQFKKGERHYAMLVIIATCKALGYDVDTTRAMCLAADEKHVKLTSDNPIGDLEEKLESVFDSNWGGGQYSCKKEGWLQTYCQGLGDHKCDNKPEKENTIQITNAHELFKSYASNIDELTIKTGITPLDKKMRMTVGMTVGILASPSVGKTTAAIQILNHMSKTDEICIFFSYDMFHALVYQKLVQKHFDLTSDQIFERFKNNDKVFEEKVKEKLKEEYGNVEFCFDSGQNIEQIVNTIKNVEDKSGKKVRLVVIDYNELILTDYSDSTASSGYIAQKLREIANQNQICIITLLQPSKVTGSPSDEITSYRSIKGSSAIEQSLGIILAMSRPGFDPRNPDDDKFITINCVKNRMGPLFSLDLFWNGKAGLIREMTDEEESLLNMVRERKIKEKQESDSTWS